MNLRTATIASALTFGVLAAPFAFANDAVQELGGRVISTHDTVISEIGGSPGAAYEDTIVEDYVYVTAPVENYLPDLTYAPSAPTANTSASASNPSSYTSGGGNYTTSSGYSSASSYSAGLANTGAAVISIVLAGIIAALAGLGTIAHKKRNAREQEASEQE